MKIHTKLILKLDLYTYQLLRKIKELFNPMCFISCKILFHLKTEVIQDNIFEYV